jgi:hypothetical protein
VTEGRVVDARFPTLRARHEAKNLEVLRALFADQAEEALGRRSTSLRMLSTQWDERLAAAIYSRNRAAARDAAERVAAAFGDEFDPDVMDNYLAEMARISSEEINATTRAELDATDEPEGVFEMLSGWRAELYAGVMATGAIAFGAHDAGKRSADFKRWQVNSSNPRPSHASMNGQTVPMGETFSNGLRWPGDPGPAGEIANCRCSLVLLGR